MNASSIRWFPVKSSLQKYITCLWFMAALEYIPSPFSRCSWIFRAAQTRVRICAEVSSLPSACRSVYWTRGTYTCKSIRSDRGPDIFRLYLSMSPDRQVHSLTGSPRYPQGQGFSYTHFHINDDVK